MAHYSTEFARQNTRKRESPGDLRALLPYHNGKDYRVVGNDIVLIEIATNLILDVMQGALRSRACIHKRCFSSGALHFRFGG